MAQITPTTVDPTGSLGCGCANYLRALSPGLTLLQAGVAACAVVLVARFCLPRILSRALRLLPSRRRETSIELPHPVTYRDFKTSSHFTNYALSDNNAQRNMHFKARRGSEGGSFGDADHPAPGLHMAAFNPANQHFIMSRPPPAPPLTPPELSSVVFTLDGQLPPADNSFMHQPNPDYTSSSTTTSSGSQPSSATSPATTRRRSYNKTIPVGLPISQQSSQSSHTDADLILASNSWPPTNPILPPAPTDLFSQRLNADLDESPQREVDVQGEIVSVVDPTGAGWTRHTRVYGGGICLACEAAGREHGAGGFYGANVRPEEKW